MPQLPLTWLAPNDPFPPITSAWDDTTDAPGLLAAGEQLDGKTLLRAYHLGIFPWFSNGQPVLWWSPDPRMVLLPESFRLHRSLRKCIAQRCGSGEWELTVDRCFERVMRACAEPRDGQSGTWIVPSIENAYTELHRMGFAHSVEVWHGSELIGGLYCVAIGKAVFGESMFTGTKDASKVALSALVAMSLAKGVGFIDCQQQTRHLAFMGAQPLPREEFAAMVRAHTKRDACDWQFSHLYWQQLLRAPDHDQTQRSP